MRTEEPNWEESRLRDAVLRGDETAWKILYERSFASLYAFVRCRMNARPESTDEVVQETWLVAVRRIRRFDPTRASFDTWLKGIATNVLRNVTRREARRDRVERAEDAIEEVPAPGPPIEDLTERIARALTLLPAHYRAVLDARYREKRPVAAIADDLGQTEKATESLLTRARAAFRGAYASLDRAVKEI